MRSTILRAIKRRKWKFRRLVPGVSRWFRRPTLPCCALLQWQPTREGYLKFLAESKTLFETLEDIVLAAPHPDCESHSHSALQGTVHFRLRDFAAATLCSPWSCAQATGGGCSASGQARAAGEAWARRK